MKKFLSIFSVLLSFVFSQISAQGLSPYIKVGVYKDNISKTASVVQSTLKAKDFDLIGSYSPEGKATLKVLVFTRNDLQQTTLKIKDRGALASVLKVGLISNAEGTTITYLNPEYIFNAYLRGEYAKYSGVLNKVDNDFTSALSALGNENRGFGGSLSAAELQKYHYKAMMPYFTDPITLNTFSSFDEGVQTIEKNLKVGSGGTKLVYKQVFKGNKVAVYGIALISPNLGEAKFLPTIGESNIAAMPYEIILQDNKATMLNGRYRIALHWPNLTMGTFMKIVSAPGNIEDAMKAVCK